MIFNRSVPMNIVLPHVFYEDVAAALTWLQEAFGFVLHYSFELPDGRIHGALMRRGEGHAQELQSRLDKSYQTGRIYTIAHALHRGR